MSKIDVYNTAIIINDYDFGDCPTLENYFKIKIPINKNYWSYKYFGIYYDEDNRKLYLPRGIDVWLVEKLIGEESNVHVNEHDKYERYNNFKIKSLTRDEEQKKALRFMLGKEEYRHVAGKSQLSLNLNTGKGKTFVSIATIAFSGIKSMIIMYQENLIQQWKAEILKYTNLNPKQVVIVSGSSGIHRLMVTNNDAVIYLITHGTLKSYGDRYGWDKVRELFKHLKIGIKIFDEAHQNFENMMMIDYFSNTYKTYYLTATSLRSSDGENRVYQMAFKNVPYVELFDPEKDPHTLYTAIKFNSQPTPYEKSRCKNAKYGLDRNKYVNYLVEKPVFYKVLTILMNIILKRTFLGGKCLIYIGTNNAISIVRNWMELNYPELYNNIGVLSTLVDEDERREATDKRIILSTTKSAGVGVDIKGLKLTVVLAEPFKSEVLARQTLGRTRDKDTEYIELVDQAFPQCTKYYSQKKPVFLRYATGCREIIMKPNYIEEKYNELMSIRNTPTWNSLFLENNGVSYYDGLVKGVYYQTQLIRGVTYDDA